MRSRLTISFAVIAIVAAIGINAFGQSKRRLPLVPGSTPLDPPDPQSQGITEPRGRGELLTIGDPRRGNVGGGNLYHIDKNGASNEPRVDPDAAGLNMIPHWSDSFTYNGLVYKYTMVGTDPKRGSATTVIPTVLLRRRYIGLGYRD